MKPQSKQEMASEVTHTEKMFEYVWAAAEGSIRMHMRDMFYRAYKIGQEDAINDKKGEKWCVCGFLFKDGVHKSDCPNNKKGDAQAAPKDGLRGDEGISIPQEEKGCCRECCDVYQENGMTYSGIAICSNPSACPCHQPKE